MFEKLQGLPLLMGLSVNDLMDIVEKVKFAFNKYSEGDSIVMQGDKCDKIIYVLNGSLCAFKRDDKRSLMIYEYFENTSYIIEPQNLWGMHQNYDRTYSFTTEGSTCIIEKKQINYLMSKYEIIKTNFLSMICNKLQYASNTLSENIPLTTEMRLKRFLRYNKINYSGKTEIKVTMQQLSTLISDTRLNVSKVLNMWHNKGIIEIKRGGITILDDKKLFS